MTTYGEAVQMGFASNLAVAVLNETTCAGDALDEALKNDGTDVPDSLKGTLIHVFNHLIKIRELVSVADQHLDNSIEQFDDANPGKLISVAQEIAELPIIKQLQDIVGMTEEERVKRAQHNFESLKKQDQGRLN